MKFLSKIFIISIIVSSFSCVNETIKPKLKLDTSVQDNNIKKEFNIEIEIDKTKLDLTKNLSIIILENDIKKDEIIISKENIDSKISFKTDKLEKGKTYKVNLSGGANDNCNIASSSFEITADEIVKAKATEFSFTEKFCPKATS